MTATRAQRLQLPLKMRHFFRDRPLTRLACQCLVNECLRGGNHGGGWRSAKPNYREHPTGVGHRKIA